MKRLFVTAAAILLMYSLGDTVAKSFGSDFFSGTSIASASTLEDVTNQADNPFDGMNRDARQQYLDGRLDTTLDNFSSVEYAPFIDYVEGDCMQIRVNQEEINKGIGPVLVVYGGAFRDLSKSELETSFTHENQHAGDLTDGISLLGKRYDERRISTYIREDILELRAYGAELETIMRKMETGSEFSQIYINNTIDMFSKAFETLKGLLDKSIIRYERDVINDHLEAYGKLRVQGQRLITN